MSIWSVIIAFVVNKCILRPKQTYKYDLIKNVELIEAYTNNFSKYLEPLIPIQLESTYLTGEVSKH